MTDMIVTTSLGQDLSLVVKARELADQLGSKYVERHKLSLKKLTSQHGPALVVYKDKLIFANQDGSQLSFHPDTAMLRMKAPHDPLLDLLGDKPLSILDTTMGLASDSILMATAGHAVTALEANPIISLIVSQGLQTYISDNQQLDQAMRSITVINQEATSYMSQLPDKSVDVVYVDPMFTESIDESHNLAGLKTLAEKRTLSPAFMTQATRIAKKAIILKAHYKDNSFETYGFDRQIRKNQKFHYGTKTLRDDSRSEIS